VVIRQLPGVGPTFAAVFVAELGDVSRFAGAPQACSWAGLTARHRESDTVHRGSIAIQGSRLVRWAAVEAVQHAPKTSPARLTYERIVERRDGTGRNHAKVVPDASCLPTSTTAFATVRSAASPRGRPESFAPRFARDRLESASTPTGEDAPTTASLAENSMRRTDRHQGALGRLRGRPSGPSLDPAPYLGAHPEAAHPAEKSARCSA
jgi:hypothetical protein